MLCVMGVLKTEKGLKIKERITNYLQPNFDILYIEQDPPGNLYEYPAIKYTLKLAIEMNEPVLYIHTKGAADPNHAWYQTSVKKLWEYEFGTNKVFKNYEQCLTNIPTIVTPLYGPEKQTWYNAMFINPAAAKIILPTLKHPNSFDNSIKYVHKNNRYYYEYFMCNLPEINIIGSAETKPLSCGDSLDNRLKELVKDLPDINY